MTESSAAMNKIEVGHQMYRDGRYGEALGFYTEALSVAKTKPQKIALHSNRAACFLKLHLFKKAAEECTAVLELDQNHTGALMLRAQTLVTLKEYHSALFDVNRLMELNPSSEVYRNLETRLRTQLWILSCFAQGKSLAPIPETDEEEEEDEKENDDAETCGHDDGQQDGPATTELENNQKTESHMTSLDAIVSKALNVKESTEQEGVPKVEPRKTIAAEVIAQSQRKPEAVAQPEQKVEPRKSIASEVIAQSRKTKESSNQNSKAWQTIPKPKGHSTLDYARWDKVEDDSSEDEDEDDEEESRPQFRFRLKTVGVQSVK